MVGETLGPNASGRAGSCLGFGQHPGGPATLARLGAAWPWHESCRDVPASLVAVGSSAPTTAPGLTFPREMHGVGGVSSPRHRHRQRWDMGCVGAEQGRS